MIASRPAAGAGTDARLEAWRVLLPPGGSTPIAEEPRAEIRRFALVPGRGDPRWYIPLDSSRATAAAASLYRPHRATARIASSLLRLAARLGLVRRYPSRLAIALPHRPALETLLARLVGRDDVRLAIYAGRAGAPQDTVVVAGITTEGSVQAVARVAVTVGGAPRVRREAQALRVLAQALPPGDGPVAPGLLWHGDVDGRAVTVQRAIRGRPPSNRWTAEHDVLLARLEHGESRPLVESAAVRRLAERVREDARLRRFAGTLERALDLLRDVQTRPVVSHRDFAPWNLVRTGEGALVAIDWEFAEIDGLPHLDRFYYRLAVGAQLRGWTTSEVASYAERWPAGNALDLPLRQRRALVVLLLLERLAWRLDRGTVVPGDVVAGGCIEALERVGATFAHEGDSGGRRLRVLMSAYACDPNRGSEPGVGWNWALQAAKDHEVWVLTRANNREVIEEELRRKPVQHLHFIYHDLPRWHQWWKNHAPFGTQIYYEWWQRTAHAVTAAAHREHRFDIGHHVTFVTCRVPSALDVLPIPFVWGAGGAEASPVRLWSSLGVRGAAGELARWASLQLARLRPSVRRTARRATLALAATSETAAFIGDIGASRVTVVPAIGHEAVGTAGRRPDRDAGSQGPLRLLFVGRLVAWKGAHLALHALARAGARGVSASLTVVGSGPEERRLRQLARGLGLRGHVRLIGPLPRDEVTEQYREHDVLVLPSLHDSGGMVVHEAMAQELPVVCLDLGGPAVSVTDCTGIRVPAHTTGQVIDGLADAIEGLARDPELRRRMSEAGRRRVAEHYTWDRKRELLREVYAEAVGVKP